MLFVLAFDPASTYSHMFCQELVDLMVKGEVPFFDCAGIEATREYVESMLYARLKAHFLFYDHGSETCLCSQNNGECVIDSNNVSLLKDRIVYTLACSWGKDGGWEAYRKGARAVHCYTEVVGFMTSALEEFQEAFNYGFKMLLITDSVEGDFFKNLLAEEKRKMTELSDDLMARGDFMSAMFMNRNRDSLVWYDGASEPPESKCFWRRVAVRLFGTKKGWRLFGGN